MALGTLRVYAVDECVLLLSIGPAVAEFAQLLAADGGVVARIKDQHHVVAAQRGERYNLAILIGEREIGH